MFKNLLVSFLLISQILSCSIAGKKDASIEKLITSERLDHFIDSLPDQFRAAEIQQKPFLSSKEREIHAKVLQVFLDSFDAKELRKALRKSMMENATDKNLKKTLEWLQTPLGIRLAEAELKAEQPEAQAEMLKFATEFQDNPPGNARIAVIQHFEKAAEQTDSTIKFLELAMKGMMSGFMKMAPASKNMTAKELKNKIDEMEAIVRPVIYQQMLAISYFIYKDFSNEEIGQYIKYLESEPGKESVQVYLKGITAVFNSFIHSATPKINDLVSKSKNRKL